MESCGSIESVVVPVVGGKDESGSTVCGWCLIEGMDEVR